MEQELRQRVRELEQEVKTLKSKLEELRKAKSTTLVKKEKEFVTTTIPNKQQIKPSPESHDKSQTKEVGEVGARLLI